MKIYNLKNSVFAKTGILILIVSMTLWFSGLPGTVNIARAGSVTSFSDTLTDSDTSVVADHTILFITPTGVAADAIIVVTLSFAGTPIPAALNFDDIDFSYQGTPDGACDAGDSELTLATNPTGTTMGVERTSSTVLTFTNGSTVITGGSEICIEVGLNAEEGGSTAEQITNSTSTGSNTIVLSGDFGDTGTTHVFMIDDIVVTASVDTNFTFTIAGVASGQTSANGETSPSTTSVTTTATTIPWDESIALVAGTEYVARMDLTVSTNAANGFIVTLQQDQNLISGSNDIDLFRDSAATATPEAWGANPLGTPGTEGTYGHYGVTSADNLNTDEFGTALYAGNLDTARQVFENNGPADGTTANVGATEIGFKIEITALQEASQGTAYTNTFTFIATPTF